MEKTKADLPITNKRPPLSAIVVNEAGQLSYSKPQWKKVIRQMVKSFPIMCWYMLIGMLTLFTRSLWAIMHRAETVTYAAELLIYIFLLFMSFIVTGGMIGLSIYQAKINYKTNNTPIYESIT